MTAFQLVFLLYTVPGTPLPELDHAEAKSYATKQLCEDEGKRQTDTQTIPKGTQRVAVCPFIEFSTPDPDL